MLTKRSCTSLFFAGGPRSSDHPSLGSRFSSHRPDLQRRLVSPCCHDVSLISSRWPCVVSRRRSPGGSARSDGILSPCPAATAPLQRTHPSPTQGRTSGWTGFKYRSAFSNDRWKQCELWHGPCQWTNHALTFLEEHAKLM